MIFKILMNLQNMQDKQISLNWLLTSYVKYMAGPPMQFVFSCGETSPKFALV